MRDPIKRAIKAARPTALLIILLTYIIAADSMAAHMDPASMATVTFATFALMALIYFAPHILTIIKETWRQRRHSSYGKATNRVKARR